VKRRQREVNIFNMSLLDILCGALGAFCFMMLALFPFYRPSAPAAGAAEPAEAQRLAKEAERLERELEQVTARRGEGVAADLARENEDLRRELQAVQRDLAKQVPPPPGRVGGARAADLAVKVNAVRSDACEYRAMVEAKHGGDSRVLSRTGPQSWAVLMHLTPGVYTLFYEYIGGPTCTITGTFLSTMGAQGPVPQVRLTRLGQPHAVVRFSVAADGSVRVK
jgi:hypothetical protein